MFKVYENENGEKFISVIEACRELGIASPPQYKKMRTAKWARTETLETTGRTGATYSFMALPLELVPRWVETLFSPNINQDKKRELLEIANKGDK